MDIDMDHWMEANFYPSQCFLDLILGLDLHLDHPLEIA
jgi:hypothetical protein